VKIRLAALVAILLCASVVAYAFDLKTGTEAIRVAPGTTTQIVGASFNAYDMPDAYTIYSGDPSESFYIRRRFDGSLENYWIKVPAGQSLLIPAPEQNMSGTQYLHTFYFAGFADTLYVLPWKE